MIRQTVNRVCAVFEKDDEGNEGLYGIFEHEEDARKAYYEDGEVEGWTIEFLDLPVWRVEEV